MRASASSSSCFVCVVRNNACMQRAPKQLCLCCAAAVSLISEDLRAGLDEHAERTFRVALTLALTAGLVVMAGMEVRGGAGA